ncbi:hypothetical protein CFIMG_007722RA00001 [Ceratocystis fimbriata CBS 114723]|uniref:Uncharacterized protein n=1 Tax=Ceratocystis fimbriata CBS 114723 TaxID=1035309 RepID=A0A2C5WVD0_9PEZI|nr:hypothetical protein CFIMG_007722RA00001 [Ceratocystis fimbriata CBS 114723]
MSSMSTGSTKLSKRQRKKLAATTRGLGSQTAGVTRTAKQPKSRLPGSLSRHITDALWNAVEVQAEYLGLPKFGSDGDIYAEVGGNAARGSLVHDKVADVKISTTSHRKAIHRSAVASQGPKQTSDVLISIPLGDTSDEGLSSNMLPLKPSPEFDIDTAAVTGNSHIIMESQAIPQLSSEVSGTQPHPFDNMPRQARRRMVAIEKQRNTLRRLRGISPSQPEPEGMKQDLEAWVLAYDRKMASSSKEGRRMGKKGLGAGPSPKSKASPKPNPKPKPKPKPKSKIKAIKKKKAEGKAKKEQKNKTGQ